MSISLPEQDTHVAADRPTTAVARSTELRQHRPARVRALALAALLSAAEASMIVSVELAVVAHVCLLLAIVNQQLPLDREQAQQRTATQPALGVLGVLSLVPILRLSSIVATVPDWPLALWYVLAGGPVALAVALVARALGRSLHSLGVSARAAVWQMPIAALGVPAGAAGWLVLEGAGLADHTASDDVLVTGVVLFVFVGLLTEVLFRGLIQPAYTASFGWWGVLVTATLSTASWAPTGSAAALGYAAATGVLAGVARHLTSSVVGVAIAQGLAVAGMSCFWPAVL